MNFDNMTPQEAAKFIVGRTSTPSDMLNRISAACQHFYERGKRDAYKHAAERALANDDFDEYYQWIEEQSL